VPFSVRKLPNEPILVLVLTDPFDYRREPPAVYERVGELIGNLPGSIYWITDLTGLTLSFRNYIALRAASYVPRSHSIESGRMHPIFVSKSSVLEGGAALENMRRARFDLTPIWLFRNGD
jgi:hypothetical protein